MRWQVCGHLLRAVQDSSGSRQPYVIMRASSSDILVIAQSVAPQVIISSSSQLLLSAFTPPVSTKIHQTKEDVDIIYSKSRHATVLPAQFSLPVLYDRDQFYTQAVAVITAPYVVFARTALDARLR